MNKLYEGMFVFDANQAGKDWPGLEQHVNDLVERNAGTLVHAERWPDRKLAYEIKGCKKGTYYLTYFNAPTTAIQGLQRDCELSDRVLRAMFVYEDGLAAECEKLKAREAAKVEAEAVAEAEAAAKADAEAAENSDDSAADDDDDDDDGDDDVDDDDDEDQDADEEEESR